MSVCVCVCFILMGCDHLDFEPLTDAGLLSMLHNKTRSTNKVISHCLKPQRDQSVKLHIMTVNTTITQWGYIVSAIGILPRLKTK